MKESQVLATIMEGLAAKRIWRKRMNSGATVSSYKGKTRMVRFGEPGMADILAWIGPQMGKLGNLVWIEVKNEKGRMSDHQTAFMREVRKQGHDYLLARSWEDVTAYLREEFEL